MKFNKIEDFLPERKYIDMEGHSNVPHNIMDVIAGFKANGLGLQALRIVLVICITLKDKQIYDKQQLSIFDKTFGDITTKNETVTFNFLWKDFLAEGSRNYKQVEKGLRELASYSGKHTFINEIGQKITVISSIISDVVINKHQNGLKFNMNLTWYRLFIQVFPYNKFPNKLVYILSSLNAFLWYIYISKMPPKKSELTGEEGFNKTDWYGPISMNRVNEIFLSKHKHWSKIEEKYLKVIKKMLDSMADKSFNYTIGKDKNLYIITYYTKHSIPISFKSEIELKTSRTLKYQRGKYKLSETEQLQLESLYKKYGYEDIYKAINRQPSLKNKKGKDYITEVHSLILAYLNSKNNN